MVKSMKRVYQPVEIKSILVLQLGGIGDLVLSTPALAGCRQAFPNAYIGLAVVPRAFSLKPAIKAVDEVFVLNGQFRFWDIFLDLRKCWESLGSIIKFRRMRFDLAVNLEPLSSFTGALKMRFFLWLIDPKFSAGRNTDNRGKFLDIQAEDRSGDRRHEVLANFSVIRRLDERIREMGKPELFLSKEDKESADKFLAGAGFKTPEILIGLNPGSFRPYGRWPAQNWAKLADSLIAAYSRPLIFISIKKERLLLKTITGLMEHKEFAVVEDLALNRLAAVLARLGLFITNDSGPMHMAAALDIPVIALFGPGDIHKFAPYGDSHIIVRKDMDCSRPCYKFKCKTRKCLDSITVDDVLSAVRRGLK
jgi:ADP-heptose:LPS heptosyltransferase